MTGRRTRLRRPRGAGEYVAAGVVAVAAATALLKMAAPAVDAVLRWWPLLAALAAGGLAWAGWRRLRWVQACRARAETLARLRVTLARLDAVDDRAFEFALRDLLIRDGWSARRVGRQGDQGADAIGESGQYGRLVIQAKHTTVGGKVGSQVMYQVKGTAGPVHGADHAVVVTNGAFTRDARAWGDRHQVHWVDRDRLRTWAEQGIPLQELLRLPGRPARRIPTRRASRTRSLAG